MSVEDTSSSSSEGGPIVESEGAAGVEVEAGRATGGHPDLLDRALHCLGGLVGTQEYKFQYGKTNEYKRRRDQYWAEARAILRLANHGADSLHSGPEQDTE